MIDWEKHIANLPDPTRAPMPPRVQFTAEGAAKAEQNRQLKDSLLDPKSDTERLAKYLLEGRLFGGRFVKDGDYVTLPGGTRVWQRKVSDLVGSVPLADRPNAHTYVEVKGVSPGGSFPFSRLDKRNNPRQPSQFEKLMAEWELGNLVWLFIGWWDSEAEPILVKQGSREVRRWRREDCEMVGTLLRWEDWLEIYYKHKYRSLRQQDRPLLDDYRIRKVGRYWLLDDNHWWLKCQ